MPRSSTVRQKNLTEDEFDYPAPDEFNIPPENFDSYVRVIYGQKGIGKTTSCSTFPDSLTLMIEPKRRGLKIRQLPLEAYDAKSIRDGSPDTWQKLVNTMDRIIDDPTVKCLNFDSIDLTYKACYYSVCARRNIDSPEGAGRSSSDVWLEIEAEFAGFMNSVNDSGMGINFISHNKERETKDIVGGKLGMVEPSCSPACLRYLKQAADIVLFLGKYDGKRACMVRDESNEAFVSPGPEGHFMQPNGKEISIFEIPNYVGGEGTTPYEAFVKAFDNELWDMDTLDEEKEEYTTPKKKVTKKKPMSRKGPPKK